MTVGCQMGTKGKYTILLFDSDVWLIMIIISIIILHSEETLNAIKCYRSVADISIWRLATKYYLDLDGQWIDKDQVNSKTT